MFTLSSSHCFHLYSEPTDMRKSFNGLSGLVLNKLGRNPMNGDVFIFINKNRDKVKLLHWVGVGYTVYYKQLERGTFELPAYDELEGSIRLNYSQLVMLLDGLVIANVHRRKRYTPTVENVEKES